MKRNYSDQAAQVFKQPNRRKGIFNLKVSESEKYKNNRQWFEDYMNIVSPGSESVIENYEEMESLYKIVNGDLSYYKDKLERFCNPTGLEGLNPEDELQDIEPYPKLYTKLNVLKGEFLKRGDNHKIILLSSKAIKDKNEKMLEAIKASVEEEVMLVIQKMQEEAKQMSEEELSKYIEELRTQKSPDDIDSKNFLSDWEIFNTKALRYCEQDQDVQSKKMDTLEDCMTSGRAFVHVGWKYGKPYIEVRNTLFTEFQKAPNEPRIHKGDWILYRDQITLKDAYNEYGSELSEEDLDRLGALGTGANNRVDKRHDVINGAIPVFDHTNEQLWRESQRGNSSMDKSIGLNMTPDSNSRNFNDVLITRKHLEFMAFRELFFLSYRDEYNELITTVLDSKAKTMIPPNAQKVKRLNQYGNMATTLVWLDELSGTQYEAMVLYIPRKYEVVELEHGIFPIKREVPYQTTNINAPYSSFSLSTKGIVLDARNAKSVSMVQRALPAYFEYLYVKKVQRDELAKYQGYIQSIDVDQIPDSLGEDEDGNKIRDKLITYFQYLKKTNKDLYSGSAASYTGALAPATRSPGSSGYYLGTAVELLNLQNLVNLLDAEIGLAMGISPQREAQFSTNTNVSDNQQAITQSNHITEPLFYIHNLLWKDVLEDWLALFRTYCKNQFEHNPDSKYIIFQYITPDGSRQLLEVTPDLLSMEDIGLWVSNTAGDQQYMQHMMQITQVIGQNPESAEVISTITKAITSKASPEEIHRMIQMLARQQEERAKEMQQMQQQAEMDAMKMQNAMREVEHEMSLDLLETTEDLKLKRELEVTRTKYILDSNDNQIPDVIETHKLETDARLREMELKLQEREIRRKERNDERMARLKELEIKANKNKPVAKK